MTLATPTWKCLECGSQSKSLKEIEEVKCTRETYGLYDEDGVKPDISPEEMAISPRRYYC